MNEREKIDEAEYFLKGMAREQNNVLAFKYELSAFLSAGALRSPVRVRGGKGQPCCAIMVWRSRPERPRCTLSKGEAE